MHVHEGFLPSAFYAQNQIADFPYFQKLIIEFDTKWVLDMVSKPMSIIEMIIFAFINDV